MAGRQRRLDQDRGATMFGRMARPTTRAAEAPSARALSTYSSSRIASVLAWTTRVKRGM